MFLYYLESKVLKGKGGLVNLTALVEILKI